MKREDKLKQAERLRQEVRRERCYENFEKTKDLVKKRKYHQAYELARETESDFSCLGDLKDYENEISPKIEELENMRNELIDKPDEPERFPEHLVPGDVQIRMEQNIIELIVSPLLVCVGGKTQGDLVRRIGLLIEKSPSDIVKKANAFLAGEGQFNGSARSGYDNYGHSMDEVITESYLYPIQLYKIKE